jgi:hypothetical protein
MALIRFRVQVVPSDLRRTASRSDSCRDTLGTRALAVVGYQSVLLREEALIRVS